MPRTSITVQAVADLGTAALTWTAVDQVNGMQFVNDGDTIVMIRNTDVSSKTATVDSVPDTNGRVGDLVLTAAAVSSGNDGVAISSKLPPHLFNQTGSLVHVDFASATGLFIAAVRIAPRR